MKLEPEVRKEIRKIAIGCLVCTLLMALGLWIAGQRDISVLWGCLIGLATSVGNFYFMSVGVTEALATGDEIKAKRKLRLSYIIRTVIMLAILALSLITDRINAIPVVAAVFYPRIIITVTGVWKTMMMRIDRRKHPEKYEEPEYEALPEEDEEDREDGFEKFVGAFAKGPVPGKDDTKKDQEKQN